MVQEEVLGLQRVLDVRHHSTIYLPFVGGPYEWLSLLLPRALPPRLPRKDYFSETSTHFFVGNISGWRLSFAKL